MQAWLRHELRLFAIALQFLTRVPVPARVGYQPAWLQASARHFPAVGGAVGCVGAAVAATAAEVWPWPVAIVLSMATTVWLTGGFHEDGLADTCDGLGGTVSRERALTIMKDSRLGTYGALGLLFVLALKALSLHAIGLSTVIAVLPLAHAASRAAAVTLIRWLPYAGDADAAKAKPLAQQISTAGWLVAWAWVAGIAGSCTAFGRLSTAAAAAGLCVAVAVTAWCGRWFARRLGGFTGDTLGATQQLAEVAIYLAVLAVMP